jgi:ATP-dependent Clp protease ATP-binding subunit ClpA
MFERYTEPARRAIFFARALALFSEAPEITSVDLLAALLWEDNSRAQSLFNLREYFPMYCGCPHKVAALPKGPNGPSLSADSKQALAWTASEANRLGDYWIDTEHLLLGLVCTQNCAASSYLARIGLTAGSVRKTIRVNTASRPDYGRVSRWWWLMRYF